MTGWYWRNYLAHDDLATFARYWQKLGLHLSIACLLFLLAGGLSLLVAVLGLAQLFDAPPSLILICTLIGSASLALAALLFAGIAVAATAYHTQRRLDDLHQRLTKLEPDTTPMSFPTLLPLSIPKPPNH